MDVVVRKNISWGRNCDGLAKVQGGIVTGLLGSTGLGTTPAYNSTNTIVIIKRKPVLDS